MGSDAGAIVVSPGATLLSSQVSDGNGGHGEARLLLEAFEVFTQASNSLESAFQQLQERAHKLSEELERKNQELEKSLREKEEAQNYLRLILERLPCGVLVLDESGKIALCNPVASDLLGQPKGKSAQSLRRARTLKSVALRAYFGAAGSRDGRNDKEVEIPFVAGGKMKVLATSGTPLNDASGAPTGTLHIIRDITEMKALQEQSKRGERLSAMGEMAVELAHEIRNPLGSIELFASLLEKEVQPDSDMRRWAENIRIGSRSLDNIVANMLHFANPFSPTFMDVDVHGVIEEILQFSEPIMRQRDVGIERRLGASDAVICGDRELLKQAILNLVLNSMQAMPAQGKLVIATRDVDRLPGGAPCGGLELQVQDTGVGIPPENLGRVFDPFFTTNKNGTGLGLSVVHQIVDKHSGFIQVESKVNVGTTFTIVLPSTRIVSGAA
jgi:PAS domain S-box-containing protein